MIDHAKDFEDERLWATNRRRWKLKRWWGRWSHIIFIAVVIILYGTAAYFADREFRHHERKSAIDACQIAQCHRG